MPWLFACINWILDLDKQEQSPPPEPLISSFIV